MTDRSDDQPLEPHTLDQWREHRASASFADGVMARLEPARPRRRTSVMHFGAGLALGLAVTAVLVVCGGGRRPGAPPAGALAPPSRGTLVARARTQVELPGATVVAEAGAQLSWRDGATGAVIEQPSGDVFYRVAPRAAAAPLLVRVSQGEVTVTGTCFAIDATAARADVLVYEGSVTVAAGGHSTRVEAGQRVRLTRSGLGPVGPLREVDTVARLDLGVQGRVGGASRQQPGGGACPGSLDLVEPGAAELQRWAEACRVAFDVAPMGYDDAMLDELLGRLELGDEERDPVRAAVREVEARADQRLASLYVDATGDDSGKASLDWMFSEIMSSADVDEPAALRRTLARERAGLQPPPADLRRVTPYEEEVRALARSGDELEQAIATRLGAARARALRRLHGGWPGLRWDVSGCPGR